MAGHLERIATFLEVAEVSSFTGAARALNTSTSAVTRHVADLETALGVQLFVRTTRRVSLTQAGVEYRAKVQPLVASLALADAAARAHQDSLSGELKISCPLSFGTRFLRGPLSAFSREAPGINLEIHLTDSFVDIIEDGYDMALRISSAPADKSTIWRKICRVPRCFVASPQYLDAAPPLEAPSDLSNHRCLSYSNQPEGNVWHMAQTSEETMRPVRLPPGFSCNNGDLLAQMAEAGGGVALLPRFIVAQQIKTGKLTVVLDEWHAPEIWLTAFYPPYQKLTLAIDRFTQVFEDHARGFAL